MKNGRKRKISKFFFLIVWPASLFSQTVWIIEKPQALRVLNAYEQTLSGTQLASWPGFVPVEVIDRYHIHADGVTRSVKVRFNNETFYLQRDLSGNVMGSANAGIVEATAVWSVRDTVHAATPKGLLLKKWPSGEDVVAPSSVRIERHWGWIDRYFVRFANTGEMCWVTFPDDPSLWKKSVPAVLHPKIPPAELIQATLDSVNRTLRTVTSVFNSVDQKDMPPLQWQTREIAPGRWIVAPDRPVEMPRTLEALAGRLRTAFLGRQAAVLVSGHVVEIRID